MWQWGLDVIGGHNVDGDVSYYDYAAANGEVVNPETNEAAEIRIGDIAMFRGGSHYKSSTESAPTGGARTSGLAEVMNIAPDAPHKYALRGVDGGSDVFGWVDKDLVVLVGGQLTLGDKVRVKQGAKTYKGVSLATFVYNNVYSVMQIGSGVAPDYIVIGVDGQITAAVHADDLMKV